MATKKDLVEAHSFSRRRLVTAFVSGAPGGREVEPARPGRTIIGGIALAILLVAGAAVLGVFKSRVEIDWDSPGIVTDKDTGALYVILPDDDTTGLDGSQPNVRGITNVTSARLILGADTEVQQAPTEEIADEEKGATIGIADAPAAPSTDNLIQSGWSACTGDGLGIQLRLRADDDPAEVSLSPGASFLVTTTGKDLYLIAEADGGEDDPRRAYAYPVPPSPNTQLTTDIGSVSAQGAARVPKRWLALFTPGGPLSLEGFGIDEVDSKAPAGTGSGVPAGAEVGDRFEGEGGRIGLFTPDGPVIITDAFAAQLLDALPERGTKTFKGDQANGVTPIGDGAYKESDWPSDVLDQADARGDDGSLCGVLDPSSDEKPAVLLAEDPQGEAEPSEDSGPSDSDVSVSPGHGAVVLSAGNNSTSGGEPTLLDERGLSHVLVDSAASDLGYGDLDLPRVPEAWVQLFSEGVALSRDDALCPPTTRQGCT